MDKKRKEEDAFRLLTEMARGAKPTTTIPKWQVALAYFLAYSLAFLIATIAGSLALYGAAFALNSVLGEARFVTDGFGPYFILGASLQLLRLAWSGYSSQKRA